MEPIQFPLKWKQPDGTFLVVNIARTEELEEYENFRQEHFRSKIPARKLMTTPDGVLRKPPNMKQWALEVLSQSLSLTVREESTGRLVALWMNKMEDPPKPSEEKNDDDPLDRPIAVIMRQFHSGIPDFFAMFQTERIFHIVIITVIEQYGRQGLATKMNKLSLQLALQNGAGAAKVETISAYAARSFLKLGFEVFKTIDYATLEVLGTTPLAGDEMLADHPEANLMARRLSPEDNFVFNFD